MADPTVNTIDASQPAPALNGSTMPPTTDIIMKDEAAPDTHPSQIPAVTTSRQHTPAARGSPHPAPPAQPPSQANPHGSPVRVYLNQKVTPYLLEGMKQIVVEEPEKPLKWLSEYLERKSREVEG